MRCSSMRNPKNRNLRDVRSPRSTPAHMLLVCVGCWSVLLPLACSGDDDQSPGAAGKGSMANDAADGPAMGGSGGASQDGGDGGPVPGTLGAACAPSADFA